MYVEDYLLGIGGIGGPVLIAYDYSVPCRDRYYQYLNEIVQLGLD
jgi:hypothetical protein